MEKEEFDLRFDDAVKQVCGELERGECDEFSLLRKMNEIIHGDIASMEWAIQRLAGLDRVLGWNSRRWKGIPQ